MYFFKNKFIVILNRSVSMAAILNIVVSLIDRRIIHRRVMVVEELLPRMVYGLWEFSLLLAVRLGYLNNSCQEIVFIDIDIFTK